jgi:type III pantothenate kinase
MLSSLVIDLGNTNLKFAVFRDGKMASLEFLPDLKASTVRAFCESNPGLTHCILSSVIRHPSSARQYLTKKYIFTELDENTPLPLKNSYQTPSTLGKDRLAASVGAYLRHKGSPVLAVTAGTCITYDFVTADGEYLGGSISPGLGMRFQALHTFTGKLPLISGAPERLTGRDTAGSIRSGVVNGILAETDGIIERYRSLYPGLKVVLSGGDMNYFEKTLKNKTFAVPNLVLEGLYKILELNAV